MFNFKRKSSGFIAAGCILLFLFANVIPGLRAPSLNICKYPLSLLNSVRREIGGMVFYRRNLIENIKLKEEINALNRKINDFQEISIENKRLTQLLSFKQNSPSKVVAARVIAHSPDNWSSVIVIDKGRTSGIREGLVVINHLGLVGRVIETSIAASKVMLMNDPDFGVSAIDQRSRQEGLVVGGLGNLLIMKYLPRDCDIEAGDTIITSGFTERYPKGMLIGAVYETGQEFSGLSNYAVIKPAADLASLEEVLVIIV